MEAREVVKFFDDMPHGLKTTDLVAMQRLMDRMGNPQDSLKFIHVAGTNGKGSTCSMLSHILSEAGYKTGLFISPHVLDFRERIQVNGEMISESDLVEITTNVKTHWEQLDREGHTPSWFETVTAVAFEYFKRQNCDIVVLEVGIGGRLDATNIIKNTLVSAITSISFDHVEMLGNTLSEIAAEKAGIIKPGGVTVCYPKQEPEALAQIMQRCGETENRLIIPNSAEILSMNISGSDIVYGGEKYHIPLMGEHQVYNTLVVIEVCSALREYDILVSRENIRSGIAKTNFPARLELLNDSPIVILDGAHNLSGAQTLEKALVLLGERNIHGVIGMVEEKDVDGVLKALAPHFKTAVATRDMLNSRFIRPEKLALKLKKYCDDVSFCDNPIEALNIAAFDAQPEDVILVCGSLYLASTLRKPAIEKFKKELEE